MHLTRKTTYDVRALNGGIDPRPAGFCYAGGFPTPGPAEDVARRFQGRGQPCEVVRVEAVSTVEVTTHATFDVHPITHAPKE